jgi:hypothetical protein
MLHFFVFPSVTDVMITRHRQNIHLPVYARRWRRAVVAAAPVVVEGKVGGVLNCMTKTRSSVVIARSSTFFVFVSTVSCSTRCLIDIDQTLLSLLLWRCQDFLLLI